MDKSSKVAIAVVSAVFAVGIIKICFSSAAPDTPPVTPPVAVASAPAAVDPSPATESAGKSDWEPIGKYSMKEIASASKFIGEMQSHVRKMDAIEDAVSKSMRSAYRNANADALIRSATGYVVDAAEENEKIAALSIPDLENQQAYEAIDKALKFLMQASNIQKQRGSVLMGFLKPDADGDALAAQLKDLELKRGAASTGLFNAFMAYRSYGYSSDAIDEKTFRLKAGVKPDRDRTPAS